MTEEKEYRQIAISLLKDFCSILSNHDTPNVLQAIEYCVNIIKMDTNPIANNIEPYSYEDFTDIVLLMWMDNVLTDKEYKSIMHKINTMVKWDEKDKKYKFRNN